MELFKSESLDTLFDFLFFRYVEILNTGCFTGDVVLDMLDQIYF